MEIRRKQGSVCGKHFNLFCNGGGHTEGKTKAGKHVSGFGLETQKVLIKASRLEERFAEKALRAYRLRLEISKLSSA